ncbi:uncharacterized protein LOC103096070 isoform X1 [Monodelphis domestica]|uniref:uncharacterized protein LOC103096070 isoform X1 n=1 Tax=Monodelphis domestica TaxID=13616 RepID=UPI00044340E3|nr:uncharacterized protein LOC103096070 isoform X1 [Monodelphis domestica]
MEKASETLSEDSDSLSPKDSKRQTLLKPSLKNSIQKRSISMSWAPGSKSDVRNLPAKHGAVSSPDYTSRSPADIWRESRFVLRAWALTVSALGFFPLLSLADGRLAVIEVSDFHSEVLGYWTNCKQHFCPNLGKVTVSKHLGMGFMFLALASQTFCLLFMGFSFRPIFRRISRCDLVFAVLHFNNGALISLSLLLFTLECWNLYPIEVLYVTPYYLCWGSGVMQYISAVSPLHPAPGVVCLFNYKHNLPVPFSLPKLSVIFSYHRRHSSISPNDTYSLGTRRRTCFQSLP